MPQTPNTRRQTPIPYCLSLGSIASVKPSPSKLNSVTVMNMANPGKIANHHAGTYDRDADNKLPHVTSSGATPMPKNDSELSNNIAPAIPNAIVIKTDESEFGIACFMIILISL